MSQGEVAGSGTGGESKPPEKPTEPKKRKRVESKTFVVEVGADGFKVGDSVVLKMGTKDFEDGKEWIRGNAEQGKTYAVARFRPETFSRRVETVQKDILESSAS